MTREYKMTDMLSLPRLNSLSAIALAEQLLTACADQADLPVLVALPRERLKAAAADLKSSIQPQEEVDTQQKREADTALDNAWRIMCQWLNALASAPGDAVPNHKKIREVNQLLFSDGLAFIKISYREQWAQSEAKLKALAQDNNEAVINDAGGGGLLNTLKTAHDAYGKALGITQPIKAASDPDTRKHYLKILAALKEYAFKVLAYADPQIQGSEARSKNWLLPLTQWEDKAAWKSKKAATAMKSAK